MAGTLKNLSVQDNAGFSLRYPTYVDSESISSTGNRNFVPPSSATHVLFSSNVDFCVAYGSSVGASTAFMPSTVASSGFSTDGGGSELNPSMRQIGGVGEICVIAASTGYLTLSYFKL